MRTRTAVFLTIMGLVFGCLGVGSASAAKRTFSGPLGAGTLTFKAKVAKQGRPGHKHWVVKRIFAGMHWEGVAINCDDGLHPLSGNDLTPIAVNNNRFNAHLIGSGFTVDVKGKFKSKARKASGTFREAGDFGAVTGCDTGALNWSAHT